MSQVVSVSARNAHGPGKDIRSEIMLIAGQGVEGDTHSGETVKHRSRVAKDPKQLNLRQVHLILILFALILQILIWLDIPVSLKQSFQL